MRVTFSNPGGRLRKCGDGKKSGKDENSGKHKRRPFPVDSSVAVETGRPPESPTAVKNLQKIPHGLDEKTCQCLAVIETTKGQRSKLKWDPEIGTWKLAGVLPRGMEFPYDFGFIPSTKAPDGDPLDIMIVMDAQTSAGCLVQVRLVGVIEAEQTEKGKTERNDRLIGVAVESHDHAHIRKLSDLGSTLINQVGQFFVSYNRVRGKKFKILANRGPKRAVALVQEWRAE